MIHLEPGLGSQRCLYTRKRLVEYSKKLRLWSKNLPSHDQELLVSFAVKPEVKAYSSGTPLKGMTQAKPKVIETPMYNTPSLGLRPGRPEQPMTSTPTLR